MTLEDYCRQLRWNKAELARQAGLDAHTASRAWKGKPIQVRVARQIAQALSEALGKPVSPSDIEGLNIQ